MWHQGMEPCDRQVHWLYYLLTSFLHLLGNAARSLALLEESPKLLSSYGVGDMPVQEQRGPVSQERQHLFHIIGFRDDDQVRCVLQCLLCQACVDLAHERLQTNLGLVSILEGPCHLRRSLARPERAHGDKDRVKDMKGQAVPHAHPLLRAWPNTTISKVERQFQAHWPIQLALQRVEQHVDLIHKHDSTMEDLQDIVAHLHLLSLPFLLFWC
mmetsp:Transcript_69945/g.176845  ORF Transcript_69945/g.176845 Transcript_69945/m.176845 type:complete len:213 (-) Transcript_69945:1190-1828(-)